MHELPKLPYSYDALEPHIDAETMTIHHTKHHQAYINNLNTVLGKYPELQEKKLEELLIDLDSIPAEIKAAVRNNGGGHWNHSFFWEIMSPPVGGKSNNKPKGKLAGEIKKSFGSFEKFQADFKKAGLSRFGSGWAWLAVDNEGVLHVSSTPNQNNPLMMGEDVIIGADVWEHAYYLKYQNKRGDYLDAFWNVLNWDRAEEIYKKIVS